MFWLKRRKRAKKATPVVFGSTKAVRAASEEMRNSGRKVVFVPTMGALHAGHQALLEAGRMQAGTSGFLVASIFVNPTQFGPGEDYDKYPRHLEDDLEVCRKAGVDAVFVPEAREMYPDDYQTFIEVESLSRGLCGDTRPGHFRGVATVVLKLLLAVRPHVAIFGEKDYQQLLVVRRMVKDLGLDVEVIGIPTVREPDGLAMSSRNSYLDTGDRKAATCLYHGLDAAAHLYAQGERDAESLKNAALDVIGREERVEVEYLELRDAETLQQISYAQAPSVLAVAAKIGGVRLIDNVILGRD